MSEYQVTFVFTREFEDDIDVIGKPVNKITNADLWEQFRKELQQAYDSETGSLAGRLH